MDIDAIDKSLNSLLTKIKKSENIDKSELTKFNHLLETFKVEIRNLDNNAKLGDYINKRRFYEKEFKILQENTAWINTDKPKDLDTTGDILQQAVSTQKNTIAHAEKTLMDTESIKNIGTATAETLDKNTQTMKNISNTSNETRDILHASSRQISVFTRRIATDKQIMCFMVIMVMLILTIIVIAFVRSQ